MNYFPAGLLNRFWEGYAMTRAIYEHSLDLHFKKIAEKGNRPGCQCMESRGLGDYTPASTVVDTAMPTTIMRRHLYDPTTMPYDLLKAHRRSVMR